MNDVNGHWISTDEYAVMEFIRVAEHAKKQALALSQECTSDVERKTRKYFDSYFSDYDLDEYWNSSTAQC